MKQTKKEEKKLIQIVISVGHQETTRSLKCSFRLQKKGNWSKLFCWKKYLILISLDKFIFKELFVRILSFPLLTHFNPMLHFYTP